MSAAPLIGPGRFVLVVGPSGGGKDTLIAGAKAALGGDTHYVFPRRIVTRAANTAEDHDTLDAEAFDRALKDDAFAVWWQAHGLKYAIPQSADEAIRAGRTVICNVSRAIIDDVLARYANVYVVMVTAPADILAARLASRARDSDGKLSDRVKRNDAYADFRADRTIDNSGTPEEAIAQLVAAIKG